MNMITSIDRISSLPDVLLCQILSYLTTKEAAATSILSKQWRYLWVLVPDIDVIDSQIPTDGSFKLCHVLCNIMIRKKRNISKIRLKSNSDSIDFTFLTSFLANALAGNVEELDLCLCNYGSVQDFYKLPRTVFSCKTLVILKLTRVFVLLDDYKVHLPSLKVLHLSYVCNYPRYRGYESVRNLISGCPILDELLVQRAKHDRVTRYDISSSTLTNVRVDCRDFDFGSDNLHNFITVLNAPALKYLTLIDPLSSSFEVSHDMDNLVEANLDVSNYEIVASRWDVDKPNIVIFRAICNVKCLQLKGVFKAQRDSYVHKYAAIMNKLPEFHNLVKLKLSNVYCIWCLFKRLLPKLPHLEHLTIFRVHMCYKRRCGMPHYPIPSKHIPACLSFHLTKLKLEKFEGFELEMGFVKCILENSEALMDMTINHPPGLDSKKKIHISKMLSSFERGSTKCQLSFVEGKY